MEQFLDTTSIQGASFSADESRLLFSSNKTGIWNAYTIPVGGGVWTPVTTSTKDSTYAVSFFPHDNRVLITRDQGGNELNHLYVLAEDGAERDLTPGDKLKAQFAGWTHDGSAFYVVSNERDARFFDLPAPANSKACIGTFVRRRPGAPQPIKIEATPLP
jgi:Tol biopolymer transport system component